MGPNRFAAAGLLALTLPAACGGIATREEGPPAGGLGGGAEGSDSGSAPRMDASSTRPGFDASSTRPGFDASPSPPALLDSSTLRVDASVTVLPRPGASPETAEVRVLVYVAEADSGIAVLDARVTGGPVGHAVPLALGQPLTYAARPHYGGMLTGYDRAWEFSVVRGADHVEGAVVFGPSYPSITLSPGAGGATIGWSPAHEGNVTTSVCVWGAASGPPAEGEDVHQGWCGQGHDEGMVFLSPANQVQSSPAVPLPTPGTSYEIQLLEGLANVPLGLQGGPASFNLGVKVDVGVGKVASIDATADVVAIGDGSSSDGDATGTVLARSP
jgi:hypothetical protein